MRSPTYFARLLTDAKGAGKETFMHFTISNLRERPEFMDVVADRCWHAWWTKTAVSLAEYTGWVAQGLSSSGVPCTMVAHIGQTYAGSVALIASDIDERPNYTRWIASLWVEEDYRRQGIAAALIEQARSEAKHCGFEIAYLCATEANSPYYRALKFVEIEENVDGLNIFEIKTLLT
jgi:GNAT superfamily N-acetyltransferase